MARRIKYTKEILNSIKKGKDEIGVGDQKWVIKAHKYFFFLNIFYVFRLYLFEAKL